MNAWPKSAAIAHPSESQFSGAPGFRSNAAAANPVAAVGGQTATQIARQ